MLPIPWLAADSLDFPPPSAALDEPDGLLAAGGDLSPQRLLAAYRQGIFPWYDDSQPILWWSPNPRTVIYPGQLHISRSLRKWLRQKRYRVTFDRAFAQVIAHCAEPRDYAASTWITPAMLAAYTRLHQLGHAHSVEVWQEDILVGGIYGIALGRVFFGESMFSRADNASKVGMAHLARQLAAWNFALIDGQVASDHLFSLGARQIPREVFTKILLDCAQEPAPPAPWPQPPGDLHW